MAFNRVNRINSWVIPFEAMVLLKQEINVKWNTKLMMRLILITYFYKFKPSNFTKVLLLLLPLFELTQLPKSIINEAIRFKSKIM